jgi:hypothetical protein
VLLTIGLLITGVLGGLGMPDDIMFGMSWDVGRPELAAALGLITLLATITTIQRILHVVRQPSTEEHE